MEQQNVASARVGAWLEHKGLNANSAAQILGYANSSKMYKILQGTSPGYETLAEMFEKWPDLSPDWLLLGKGEMSRAAGAQAAAVRPPSAGRVLNSGQVVAVTVDKDGDDNTELVPIHAQAGYAVQHTEVVFVQDLPRYRVPGFEHGKFRAFEVAGDSMEPTLNHRDIVVCSYVDNWRLLVPDDVYVVVTTEAVMLKRIRARITSPDDEVLLYSDNPHRRPYPLDVADITELWRVRGYISTYLASAPDVTIERLWDVIEQLGFDKGEVRRHLDENAPSHAPS